MSLRLTHAAARSLFLAAQGLDARPPAPARKEDVLAAVRRMHGLQIDTISVVARSPYLVLWSRIGAFEPRWLDELLAEGALFEYWSRAACFLPIEDYGLYRRRMLETAERDAAQDGRSPEQQEAVCRVLERVREGGSVRSIEFTRADGKGGGWWDWKPEKRALEQLFNAGVLMIARREGFQRVYDLHERVLPGWDDARAPSPEEARREFTLKAVRALGAAPARWLPAYFPSFVRPRPAAGDLDTLLAELVREGQVAPVEVEGWSAPAYVHRDHLERARQAAEGALRPSVTTLLSPFDPVVHDRKRARELFGFDYRIEVYTPAARRQYGYYTLPILFRDALVGRLDPKAHRKDGVFEVKAIHLEPGVPITDELVSELGGALRNCAAWHRTPEVVIRATEPAELLLPLRSALQREQG
jgi:uncharacterized protein